MNRLILKALKFFIRRFAQYHDFIDPINLLAKISRFGQPSEVAVPTELLRAGARMHARGLLNSQAIQYNLDWTWPFWVNRQFDPENSSFLPRAFSLTHINLTHRNWTAVGLPGSDNLPIVDPRGLVTPFHDSWSLDFWMNPLQERPTSASETDSVQQNLLLENNPSIVTEVNFGDYSFDSTISLEPQSDLSETGREVCSIDLSIKTDVDAWFSVALRPYNPEGISTINSIQVHPQLTGWDIEDDVGSREVLFEEPPDRHVLSNFDGGDVSLKFPDPAPSEKATCDLGLVNAAGLYRLNEGESKSLHLEIPTASTDDNKFTGVDSTTDWATILSNSCGLSVPDDHFEFLFESSKRTLINLSNGSIYPGPFTYKRFWFRDASFMLNALLVCGFEDRVESILDNFPDDQTIKGYFCSQKGEWDSNGQVLWILQRFREITHRSLSAKLINAARKGARWIVNKRLPDNTGERHSGLLPAGFSAEHFGPNDYYYWDNFWAIKGLKVAAELCPEHKSKFLTEAVSLEEAIETSLDIPLPNRSDYAMPAAPGRNFDAGAVGNMVAGYPLQIFEPDDRRLLETAEALRKDCFVDGAFFQEMIHSGLNPYLSLHIAQVLMNAGHDSYWSIVKRVAELASDTGKWPEALHPRTNGGCMGDGEHGWAAAEWIMMLRNMFVRERNETLILGQGIPTAWLDENNTLEFGPVGTRFGSIDLTIEVLERSCKITFRTDWHELPSAISIEVDGYKNIKFNPEHDEYIVKEIDPV